MFSIVLLILSQSAAGDGPPLPPGVEVRTITVNRSFPCTMVSEFANCDDPTVSAPELEDVVRTTEGAGRNARVIFVGKRPGKTTCSCGLSQGFRGVYVVTVLSVEDAVAPVARKIVGSVLARLYSLDALTAVVP